MNRIMIIFFCTLLASCVSQPLRDASAIQQSAKKNYEKALSELTEKGYSCSENELTTVEKKLFIDKGFANPKKYTCSKFNDGFLCVDYFFVDLYVADGALEYIDQQTVPICP